MSNLGPESVPPGERLKSILCEALDIADQLEWHFVAAHIDSAISACTVTTPLDGEDSLA